MKLRNLIGTAAVAVAATGALYGTASATPSYIDSGSAGSGSADGASDGGGTLCGDGTVSPSTGPGTCSHHGGEQKNQGHVHHGGGGHGRR
ncbi:hypothetical protein [Nocardia veterana]|uniref:Small secreted domain DUF320 n=1 Tax=Nocardia veterana TaxID=132249 RepID=A0A7X6LZZ5_9NOCA|nr:hypothetical protein [Nocardia veterana]NKY87759.1 hypothetical protein [Nocardia veterana]